MLSIHYVAGFFDGEGCVYLYHNMNKLRLQVTVANTNPDVLIKLQEDFGGGLSIRNRETKKHKEIWVWTASGQKAIDFLKAVQEHLIIKKPITKLAISAFEAREELSRSDNEIILTQARFLNRRGPTVE
jgi:hypothetical protein